MSREGRAATTLPNPNQTDPSSDAVRASGPFEQSLHWDAPKLPVIRNVFPRLGRPWRSAMLVVTCYGVRAYVNRGPLPGRCEVEEPIVPMVNNSARRQRSNQRNARSRGANRRPLLTTGADPAVLRRPTRSDKTNPKSFSQRSLRRRAAFSTSARENFFTRPPYNSWCRRCPAVGRAGAFAIDRGTNCRLTFGLKFPVFRGLLAYVE